MSKQFMLRIALTGACALMMGLAGCQNHSAATTPAQPVSAGPPPGVMDQINRLPPDQRQRAMDQIKGTAAGAQAGGAGQAGAPAGGK